VLLDDDSLLLLDGYYVSLSSSLLLFVEWSLSDQHSDFRNATLLHLNYCYIPRQKLRNPPSRHLFIPT